MLGVLGIIMYIIAHFVYDLFGQPYDTNSSILYYSLSYIGVGLMTFNLFINVYYKFFKYLVLVFTGYLAFLMGMELSCINLPYTEYESIIANKFLNVSLEATLAASVVLITGLAWKKYLRRLSIL